MGPTEHHGTGDAWCTDGTADWGAASGVVIPDSRDVHDFPCATIQSICCIHHWSLIGYRPLSGTAACEQGHEAATAAECFDTSAHHDGCNKSNLSRARSRGSGTAPAEISIKTGCNSQ